MKKIFLLMAAGMMSVAMWAGENDLLWDYTENAPGSSRKPRTDIPNRKDTEKTRH